MIRIEGISAADGSVPSEDLVYNYNYEVSNVNDFAHNTIQYGSRFIIFNDKSYDYQLNTFFIVGAEQEISSGGFASTVDGLNVITVDGLLPVSVDGIK